MNLIGTSAKKTLSFAKQNPLLLFLIQIPVGLLGVLQSLLEPYLEWHPVVALIILLPLFSMGSSLSTALTFLVVQTRNSDTHSNFSHDWKRLTDRFTSLAGSSFIVALFFGLGLAALILPGFYFLAIYIFVPILAVSAPPQPISQYLYKSKKMITQSRKILFTTIGLVTLSFLAELPLSLIANFLSSFFGGALIIDAAATMMLGALLDCFIVFYFLNLQSKGT